MILVRETILGATLGLALSPVFTPYLVFLQQRCILRCRQCQTNSAERAVPDAR
jgi:hypothetical protein